MGKFGVWLHKWDIPLESTKFGKYLEKVFKFTVNKLDTEGTKRFVPKVILDKLGKSVIRNVEIFAFKIEGKSLAKTLGRVLLRIPVISVLALSLLELPAIIKKIKNENGAKNKVKEGSIQIIKSSINVSSILTGIGLIGALFARKGPAFSLLGMGVGSIVGAYTSKFAQNKINDFIKS
jgi:hypothetical protein